MLPPAAATAQVAIAWNDAMGGGQARLAGTRPPFAPRRVLPPAGGDPVLALPPGGGLVALSRRDGRITVFTPRWRARRIVELGAAAAAEDIAVVSRCRAYVSRRTAARLLRVDLCSGAMAESVDLAAFADGDGNPDLGTMIVSDGRLFVQVRRTTEDGTVFVPPAYLAVVDLASEQLVDAEPAMPGVQAIALQGTAPKHRMQIIGMPRRLYVSATGAPFDAGGLEAVDADGLRSLGLVVREADGLTGADLGPFVFVTPERGYLIFSTDLDLSSHLQRFSLTGGVETGRELYVTVGYAVPALAFDPLAGTLFLADGAFGRRGLYAFDAASGQRLSGASPVPTDGLPTDLLALRR